MADRPAGGGGVGWGGQGCCFSTHGRQRQDLGFAWLDKIGALSRGSRRRKGSPKDPSSAPLPPPPRPNRPMAESSLYRQRLEVIAVSDTPQPSGGSRPCPPGTPKLAATPVSNYPPPPQPWTQTQLCEAGNRALCCRSCSRRALHPAPLNSSPGSLVPTE